MSWLKKFGSWIWLVLGTLAAALLYLAGSRSGKVGQKIAGLKAEKADLKASIDQDLAGRDEAVKEAEAARTAEIDGEKERKERRDDLIEAMVSDPDPDSALERLKRSQERTHRRRDRRRK